MRAFPEEGREIRKLPRAWINNVIYTLDCQFANWVQLKQKERTDKLLKEENLGLNLDPEIAAIFQNSNAISCKYLNFT